MYIQHQAQAPSFRAKDPFVMPSDSWREGTVRPLSSIPQLPMEQTGPPVMEGSPAYFQAIC